MTRDSQLHRFFHKQEPEIDYLARRVAEIRQELQNADPETLARNTASEYRPVGEGMGEFRLHVWGREVVISFPDFEAKDAENGKPLDTFSLALLAYHFRTASGAPPAGKWIAFTELPDGIFYARAFQTYSGHELAKTFGNDENRFVKASEQLNGWPLSFGDRAFRFQVLPNVALMAVCWLGDEDFAASYRILFDAAASEHLPTDACAVVGGNLARRLIRADGSSQDKCERDDLS